MIMQQLVPILLVDDIEATVEFYTKKLGFDVGFAAPDRFDEDKSKKAFALLKRDAIEIMAQTPKCLGRYIQLVKDKHAYPSVILYIYVDNADELFEQLKMKVEIAEDMRRTFCGMKEFAILDNNGYVIAFAEKC